jgi:tetratricopeptide (TPR) repeat protein
MHFVMEDEVVSKHKITLTVSLLVCLSSCSWMTSKRSLFGSEPATATESVSKEQYNQLLKKYDSLMKEKKMAMIKSEKAKKDSTPYDPFDLSRDKSTQAKEQLVEDVVSQLAGVEDKQLNSTVSAFNKKRAAHMQKPVIESTEYDSALVEEHMAKIRKADKLQQQNKLDAALVMIKELDTSPVLQIRVRAKYLLAEILFKQGEFDLAMQVYEEVLTQYAFSGLVIKTLGRLIVCSDKLKLAMKQEKYYSMLHDFFEEGAS